MRSIPKSYSDSDNSSLTSTTDVRRPKNSHYVSKRQPQYTYSTEDESTYNNIIMSADDSSRDDRNDHMNNIEDIYNENGSRDESLCRDYASTYSSHSSNNRGQNSKQHRNSRHRRSRRDISLQHSTSTTSSMSTSNSNNNCISNQQFWTTLSIHAASAVMSSTASTSIIPKQLKIEAATIASTSLLQHATTRGSDNNKKREKITSQTIRNAASKASIAILSNCSDGNSEINTELATDIAGAILKEGNRKLKEMNQVDCTDDKSETGLSKKSSLTSSTRDSSISTTSEGGGTSLHHRTQMEPTSPQDTMQDDDQTIQSISTSKFGSDKYQQLDQPKRKKKNDTTPVTVRSISTSKYGKDKYAIDIVGSARSVSGEESSVPAVITKRSRVSVKDSLSGGSGSRSSNKDNKRSASRAAFIQSKESNRMEAVAAGSTLSSLSVYTEPPKAFKEEATKASSNQSIANNSDDPSQVTTYQGDTSYLQSSIDSISSSQNNSNEQQMQNIRLQEDELERKHANFLAAMEKLQSKLDILEGRSIHGQQQPGSLTREQLLSLAAKSSESPSDLSMKANPTLHNLSSTESLSIHGRYSIPHCSTSVLSSMNNKLQPQSHNYHHQQPQRPIRSVLRQPTRCFPIIEGEDQEYDDEDLQEFCKDLYNNLEGDATWDEDGSVFLSVGECRTMQCEDNRDKYAEGGVPEKTTEEAIEIVLLKDGDQHEQSSESLKNRVKDFFRGKRSKKVTFDVDIDPSTRNTSSGRYTPTTSSVASARRRSRARKLLRRLKLQRRRLMTELRNLGRRYANEPKPSRVREDIIITRTGMDTPSQRVEEGKKDDDDIIDNNDTAQGQKNIDLDMSRGSAQQSLPSSVDSLAPQIRFKRSNSTDSTNTSQAVCETSTIENATTKDVNTTPAAEDDKVLVEAMAVVAEAQKDVSFADNNQYDEDASQYVADVVQAKDDEISCGVETVLSKKEVESVLSTKEAQSVASSSPSLFGFNFV